MDINEVRRVMNLRVKVMYLDKSDIDYTLNFWMLNFLIINFISGFLFNGGGELGGYVVIGALFSIFPIAFMVKKIKSGKNKGHLEFLFYKLVNLNEGSKTSKIFIYNLNKSKFTFKTMFYLTKRK
jgi:hypothetical protein